MSKTRLIFILGILVFLRLFEAPLVMAAQVDTFDTPGFFNYTVPAGVTQIQVELWGAGGAGGSDARFSNFFTTTCAGGGGGSGEYTRATLDVTPGQIYRIMVGVGGPTNGEGADGAMGSQTEIYPQGAASVLMSASGGQGGFAATNSGCNAPGGAGGSGGVGANATHTPGTRGASGNADIGGAGGAGIQGFGSGGNGSDDETLNPQPGASGRAVITAFTPPATANDSYNVAQDTVLFIPAPGVLANDGDAAGGTLRALLVSGPASGILALNADGSFFYTPNSGFVGIDTFVYKAFAGTGATNPSGATATVSITVTPSGTSSPTVRAQLVPAVIRVGDSVSIDVSLENPFLAAGGGIDAVETRCSLAPTGIVSGILATTSPDIFKPDPVVVNKVTTGDNLLYAVSQSGANPLVKTNGKIFTISLSAQKVGQATLNCTAKGIDGAGKEFTLPFVGVVVDVQNLVSGTGNIKGVVHFSHKPDGGATVTLLNAANVAVTTATTLSDGSFIMTGVVVGTYTIRAESPGYLYAEGSVTVANQQTVTKAAVKLLAGDLVTTTPVVIDELDVVQLALNYGQTIPPAAPASDLNGDNVVGLADLNALAENLRKTGPIPWN